MKVSTSKIKSKLSSVFFTLFNRLENNNNADSYSNGEKFFLAEYIRSLRDDVVLFDVGANVGNYSEIVVDLCKENQLQYSLHLFEPTQSCFTILEQKFSSNKNIHLNNVGVSAEQSTAEIFYDAEKSGFASLYQRDLSALKVEMSKKETISLMRLDEYISQNNIKKIDFLKIDIEGHELSAFRGLGKYLNADFIQAIQFEYGGANLDSGTTLRQLYKTLQTSGFRIYKIMKNGIEPRSYHLNMENYQYANYVALSPKYFSKL